jgi:predicted transcriptional regulator
MKKRNKIDDQDARDPRIVIYTRIKSETVHALDEIRESMPFTPTRAQVIDAALAEYVMRHGKSQAALRVIA